MEILQFLLSFLANEYGQGKYKSLFELLQQNSFDIKSTLKNADLSTLAPVFMDFMSMQIKNSPHPVGESFGLLPLDNIADKKIIECLNCYLGEN